MSKSAKSVFIAIILASQVLLPASYYLSDRTFDERFAWRMFSPIRVTQCSVTWFEGPGQIGTPIRPETEIGAPWISLMRRARRPVIVAYARYRCAQMRDREASPVLRARILCDHPDGEPRTIVSSSINLCESLR